MTAGSQPMPVVRSSTGSGSARRTARSTGSSSRSSPVEHRVGGALALRDRDAERNPGDDREPDGDATIERCSSVRSPIAGRLCRMNESVSTASPSPANRAAVVRATRAAALGRAPVFQMRGARSIPGRASTRRRRARRHTPESCDSYAQVGQPRTDFLMTAPASSRLSLLERLEQGPVICAEGYLFEFERRGYLQAGAFVPEVVLEHPEVVDAAPPRVRARRLGRRRGVHVLRAPREAARRSATRATSSAEPPRARDRARGGATRAARSSPATSRNTNVFDPPTTRRAAPCARCSRSRPAGRSTPASTSSSPRPSRGREEALIALDVDQADGAARRGHARDPPGARHARGLEPRGGLPAARGRRRRRRRPQLHPRPARRCCRCSSRSAPPCAATSRPCRSRTARTTSEPSFQSLRDPHWHGRRGRPFPTALDPFTCNRYEIADFGREALALGVRYLGVCCGAGPHHIRASPRRSEAHRRQRATPPTCRSTPS